MPRKARVLSSTGVYHVVSRGTGQQLIFEDDADRQFFMRSLKKVFNEENASLLAWCLMSNHVHLLLQFETPPGTLFRRLNTRYAEYFNRRHNRTGHLFQDRFLSEPVETTRYLLVVTRYIHLNPVHAGLVDSCAEYKWSSYLEYLTQGEYCDTAPVLSAFGDIHEFEVFHKSGLNKKEDPVPIDAQPSRMTDEQALRIVKTRYGENTLHQIKLLNRIERDAMLRALKKTGLSCRQLARMTGLGYNIVVNA